MTITVRDLIEREDMGGGMLSGKKVKGVLPGGVSMGILTAAELDMKMDFEDRENMDYSDWARPPRWSSTKIRTCGWCCGTWRFYGTESCGQCTQCREGTAWMHKIATRIALGAGRVEDLDILLETSRNMGMMPGLSICGLPDGATYPIETIVKKFRGELEASIRSQPADRAKRVLSVLN